MSGTQPLPGLELLDPYYEAICISYFMFDFTLVYEALHLRMLHTCAMHRKYTTQVHISSKHKTKHLYTPSITLLEWVPGSHKPCPFIEVI